MIERVYFCSLRPELAELGDLSTPLIKRQLAHGLGRLSEWPLDDYHCWSLDRRQIDDILDCLGDHYWRRVDTLTERRIDVYA